MTLSRFSVTSEEGEQQRQRLTFTLLMGLLLCGVLWFYFHWQSVPQLGNHLVVYRMTDGLYTALRSKDVSRVAQCEQRLQTAHELGQLPDSAWAALQAIIATARHGQWQLATKDLYDLMIAQRGVVSSVP